MPRRRVICCLLAYRGLWALKETRELVDSKHNRVAIPSHLHVLSISSLKDWWNIRIFHGDVGCEEESNRREIETCGPLLSHSLLTEISSAPQGSPLWGETHLSDAERPLKVG